MQSNAQVAQELEITKQEIDDERGIDLGQHGVFRVADEGLDLQVLLDETEEDLDLPAFFVLTHSNRFREISGFFNLLTGQHCDCI